MGCLVGLNMEVIRSPISSMNVRMKTDEDFYFGRNRLTKSGWSSMKAYRRYLSKYPIKATLDIYKHKVLGAEEWLMRHNVDHIYICFERTFNDTRPVKDSALVDFYFTTEKDKTMFLLAIARTYEG